jgi:hypothetical protein
MCSRVCNAIRKARFPSVSVTPMILPGILFILFFSGKSGVWTTISRGIPKRCVVQEQLLHPFLLEELGLPDSKYQQLLLDFVFSSFGYKCCVVMNLSKGYWSIAPKYSDEKSNDSWFPTTSSTPIGVERVCKTDKVCGNISSETKNIGVVFLLIEFLHQK